jgi:lysophospholipase L1-like esterase
MKNTSPLRRNFIPFVLSSIALAWSVSAADVSTFPSRDQLPGKVPPYVWPGLAKVWSQRHAVWKSSASNDVGAVVFLGDSITQGWGGKLATSFPNLKVANRGIGGDITSGVLYRLQEDVLALNPSAIVLLIGTNDAGDGATGDDIADNTKSILQAIKKFNPNLKVIVCQIMPREDKNADAHNEVIKKANSLVADYVKTEPNFALCDTWTAFCGPDGKQDAADFVKDRLHLNAAGYAVWKKTLDPVMASSGIK